MVSNVKERDRYLSLLLITHLTLMCCKNLLLSSTFVYKYSSILNICSIAILILLYSYYMIMKNGINHIRLNIVGIILAIALFWLISFLFDQKLFVNNRFPYSYVRKNAVQFLAYGLPLFYVVASIDDFSYVKYYIFRVSDFLFYMALGTFVISVSDYGMSQSAYADYSMGYGNNILLCCAFMCFKYVYTRKFTSIIKILVMSVLIFVSGSRGPLVAIVAFLIYSLFFVKGKSRKEIIRNTCIIILVLFVLLFYKSILTALVQLFDKMNISGRSLSLLARGDFFTHDSGRSDYHVSLVKAINQSPILGLGAFGGEKTVSLSHSFYLDVFANFGYLFGSCYLCWIFYSIFALYKKETNNAGVQLMMVNALMLFPRGFFDDNFWGTETIWIVMGILINYSFRRKACYVR